MNQKLLNLKEVSKVLNVSYQTVKSWTMKHTILPESILIRLGRRILVHQEKLSQWIDEGCPTELDKVKK